MRDPMAPKRLGAFLRIPRSGSLKHATCSKSHSLLFYDRISVSSITRDVIRYTSLPPSRAGGGGSPEYSQGEIQENQKSAR